MDVQAVEAINMKDLKEACKALNDTGEVDPKIKVVGTKKEKLIKLFIKTLETLHDDNIDLPTVSIEFYNSLPEDEEPKEPEPEEPEPEPEETEPEKPEPKPEETEPKKKEKPKTKKKEAKKTPAKKETKRDDYGYLVGSLNSTFVKAIKRKAMTMADVKELDWNEKGRTFYDVFNALVEKGLAVKDEKTSKMKIVKK
ncbi:MAG: hypothetical protein ACTSSG_14260 [Candidatus Heimdallarchaeaceae archaeon]